MNVKKMKMKMTIAIFLLVHVIEYVAFSAISTIILMQMAENPQYYFSH